MTFDDCGYARLHLKAIYTFEFVDVFLELFPSRKNY